MAQLPLIHTDSESDQLRQTRWKSLLDPVLTNPMNSMNILPNIKLTTGTNVINHRLGKTQQGWLLTDINAAAQIYRSAAFNDKTLTLTSDADCTVSIAVF